jgi:hypothetical protein
MVSWWLAFALGSICGLIVGAIILLVIIGRIAHNDPGLLDEPLQDAEIDHILENVTKVTKE